MIATKWGKCEECQVSVEEKREFLPQLDLFSLEAPVGITPEMREQIIEFRDAPTYCSSHRPGR